MIARRLINHPYFGRNNPFSEFDRMIRNLDRLSGSLFREMPHSGLLSSRVYPAINLTEDSDKYYLRAELPGIKAEDLDIQINGRNLTISGERKIKSEGENSKYHRRERESGKFSKALSLPGDINADSVEAKMKNGFLTIAISKSEAAKPRQITVH